MGVGANAGPEARDTSGDGPQADGNVETLGVAIPGDIASAPLAPQANVRKVAAALTQFASLRGGRGLPPRREKALQSL